MYVSTYNMTCMTIERHLAITKPLQYDADKVRRRIPFVFFFTWVLVFAAVVFVPATTVIIGGVCMPGLKMFGTFLMDYYAPNCFVISLIIPMLIMIVCYTRMFLALR